MPICLHFDLAVTQLIHAFVGYYSCNVFLWHSSLVQLCYRTNGFMKLNSCLISMLSIKVSLFTTNLGCLTYYFFSCSGSLFTNSNWFAFEEDNRVSDDRSTGPLASPSPNAEGTDVVNSGGDDVNVGEDDELVDTATSSPEPEAKSEDSMPHESGNLRETESKETDKPPEWVEWRETSDSGDPSDILPNGELQLQSSDAAKPSPSSPDTSGNNDETATGPSAAASEDETPSPTPSEPSKSDDGNPVSDSTTADNAETTVEKEGSPKATESDKKENKVEEN